MTLWSSPGLGHVFGKSTRKEFCYDNLHISRNAWDTNLVKVNPEYLSVNWEASGGGAFAVIPLNERGKLPDQMPLFRGHTAAVLDTDWLAGHSRKVGQVLFNPAAENILASASGDFTIKLWDISAGQAHQTLRHTDIVQSLTWNATGTLMATTSRDKKIRVWDVRQERAVSEHAGHAGAKNSRAVWMGEHNRIVTTGFSRMSERQIALWEPGNSEPIGGFTMLDSISGVCMPFWDEGSNCLYLAGKGDGNIRYFEYENDKFEFLTEYKSGEPQRGIAFLPRRGLHVHENEVMRAYKTVNDSYIEPISFTVPRRAETFQSDIYPRHRPQGCHVLGTSPRRSPRRSPSPLPAASGPSQASVPVRQPVSTSDQKASISAMANKYQDQEEDSDDDDDASSFEEVSRPPQRAAAPAAREEPKPRSPVKAEPAPRPSGGNISADVYDSLQDIKQMIQEQQKLLRAQSDQIVHLTQEIETLKRKVASGSQDQSERIRQLELELEALRS
ncbi:unnamed protein product [Parascedosporium putredinis]|uniref:Coronin n=1 Tax=Parascedosporium putredinis TaxID=1442378 RepID=A0A9P1GWD9_9PEZI|nr:unnamed protein product [Parascedosporium putredinis]CAI7988695.1 unnamed protein product [Parascedosporium putredinis]